MKPLQLWVLTSLQRGPATTKEISQKIKEGGGQAERRQLLSTLRYAKKNGLLSTQIEHCGGGGYQGQQYRWSLTADGAKHLDHTMNVANWIQHPTSLRP